MNHIDTITIYNKVGEEYKRFELEGVYWYGSQGLSISGRGVVSSDDINVFIPKAKMEKYKPFYEDGFYTIQQEDRIVKGVGPEITSAKDLANFERITVTSFSVNIVNSDLDNILIVGK